MVEGRNAEFVFFFPLLNRKQKNRPLKLFFIDISKKKEKAQGPFCSVDHLGFPFAVPTPPFHCSVNGTKYIHFLPFFFLHLAPQLKPKWWWRHSWERDSSWPPFSRGFADYISSGQSEMQPVPPWVPTSGSLAKFLF